MKVEEKRGICIWKFKFQKWEGISFISASNILRKQLPVILKIYKSSQKTGLLERGPEVVLLVFEIFQILAETNLTK